MKRISFLLLLFPALCFGGQFKSPGGSGFAYHCNGGIGSSTGLIDSSTNGWPATLESGAIYTAGRYGEGVYLDGVSDFINVSLGSWKASPNFTFLIGIKIVTLTSGDHALYSVGGVGSFFVTKDGASEGIRSDTPSGLVYNPPGGVNTLIGKWIMIGFTINSAGRKIYLNGELVSQSAAGTTISAGSISGAIGAGYNATYAFSNFVIDEIIRDDLTAWSKSEINRAWEEFRGRHINGEEN